jgi:YVTN family beta-propeller protein
MKKPYKIAFVLTVLWVAKEPLYASVQDRSADTARLSAFFCSKNVLDAARASVTPTLHPNCLKSASDKLAFPKDGEFRELINHPEAMTLLDAMIQYRLNNSHLPTNYKFASVKGMEEVIKRVFVDHKDLKTALLNWESHRQDYMAIIFPNIQDLVVHLREAYDTLNQVVRKDHKSDSKDELLHEADKNIKAALALFPYYIDSLKSTQSSLLDEVQKAYAKIKEIDVLRDRYGHAANKLHGVLAILGHLPAKSQMGAIQGVAKQKPTLPLLNDDVLSEIAKHTDASGRIALALSHRKGREIVQDLRQDKGADLVGVKVKSKLTGHLDVLDVPNQESIILSPDNDAIYISGCTHGSLSKIDLQTRQLTFIKDLGAGCLAPIIKGHEVYSINKPKDGSVASLDVTNLKMKKLITSIKLDKDPQFLALSPDGKSISVIDFKSSLVFIIDTATNSAQAPIKVGSGIQQGVFSPNSQFFYTINLTKNDISEINIADNRVKKFIKLNQGNRPFYPIVSADGKRLYVTSLSSDVVFMMDTQTWAESVIKDKAMRNPSYAIMSKDDKYLYVIDSYANAVFVIDTSKSQVIHMIPVGKSPVRALFNPSGRHLFVLNQKSRDISVIDTTTHQVTYVIGVDGEPVNAKISPDGKDLYVLKNRESKLSIFELQYL